MTHRVIYVPGIHDNSYHVQSTVIQYWRLFGVNPVCHEMPWLGKETNKPKLARLVSTIDGYRQRGDLVSLVGTSAGAGAVLNALVERPNDIAAVVSICGKILHPETISPETYEQNPAFRESLELLETSLPAISMLGDKILSYYSLGDDVVPYNDSHIAGADEHIIDTHGHGRSIAHALVVGAPAICGFITAHAA